MKFSSDHNVAACHIYQQRQSESKEVLFVSIRKVRRKGGRKEGRKGGREGKREEGKEGGK
jgi:hypothetical protein